MDRYKDPHFGSMNPDDEGDWVLYADVCQVRKKNVALNRELDDCADENQGLMDGICEINEVLNAANDKVAALGKRQLDLLSENGALSNNLDIVVNLSKRLMRDRRIWRRAFVAQTTIVVVAFVATLIIKY